MKSFLTVLILLVCAGSAAAWYPWVEVYPSPTVFAESPYANPYFRPNRFYNPRPTAAPVMIYNPFINGEKAEPPRSLFEILIHDTGAK